MFQWELVPADEGSAKGAAIVAAVAEKMGLWAEEFRHFEGAMGTWLTLF